MKDLSIIIVSYNTEKLTKQCVESLIQSLSKTPKITTEIIVIDNASEDNSPRMLKAFEKSEIRNPKSETNPTAQNIKFKSIFNNDNLGYGRANNVGVAAAQGRYVLYLNSDVVVSDVDFEKLIDYMDDNKKVGVLTVAVMLPNGKIDMASHRGFPTIWNSVTYFTKLEKLTKSIPVINKIFGGYHLTHLNLSQVHEIDSPAGAFYLSRKEILDHLGGFDPAFFMYGEDLDLSYRIKKLGYTIVYYPLFTVLHLKYQSGIKRGEKRVESKTKKHFYTAMRIFYDKHFAPQSLPLKNKLVHFFIDLKSRI